MYAVVYTGLWAYVRLVIYMELKAGDLLWYFCHYRLDVFPKVMMIVVLVTYSGICVVSSSRDASLDFIASGHEH